MVVGASHGHSGGLWVSCLAWVFLTLSAYFGGKGCLSGGSLKLDSPGICHPWHRGPFHSGPRTHLCGCVFNSLSRGETRLPAVPGLGVGVQALAVVGDGTMGVKTFAGHRIVHGGVLGVV